MPDRRIFCIVALFIMLLLSHCGPQGQSILGKTGPNLIKNSSFETGIKSPDEWQIVTGADKEMPVMRWGDYHNKPERFISVELSKPAIAGWQQKVQLEPDGWYKLSASVKAEEVEGQGLGAAIVFSNFRWMQFPALKGTTEWQRMEAELINAGFTQMDLVCSLGAFGMNSGYAMFDDVSLVRMADPAVRDDLTREITIGSFKLRYDKERGYLTSLKPVDDAGKSLEFLGSYPTLPYLDRDKDCFLGDLTLVVRQRDSWEKLSTARSRHRISDGRHGLEIRNTFEEKRGLKSLRNSRLPMTGKI